MTATVTIRDGATVLPRGRTSHRVAPHPHRTHRRASSTYLLRSSGTSCSMSACCGRASPSGQRFFANVPIEVAVGVLLSPDNAAQSGRLDLPGAAAITSALITAGSALSSWVQVGLGHPLTLALGAGRCHRCPRYWARYRRTAHCTGSDSPDSIATEAWQAATSWCCSSAPP